MPIISGLKKIFKKKDRFAPPNESMLNSKEKESIVTFFCLLICVIIVTIALFATY